MKAFKKTKKNKQKKNNKQTNYKTLKKNIKAKSECYEFSCHCHTNSQNDRTSIV